MDTTGIPMQLVS